MPQLSRHESPLFDRELAFNDVALTRLWRRATEEGQQKFSAADTSIEIPSGTPLVQSATTLELGFYGASDAELKNRIRLAKKHLAVVRMQGLHTVSYAMGLRSDLKPTKTLRRPNTIVALTATNYVPNSIPLSEVGATDMREERRATSDQALLQYLSWCSATKQPLVLADVYTRGQRLWQPDLDIIYLGDISPNMASVENPVDDEIAHFRELVATAV